MGNYFTVISMGKKRGQSGSHKAKLFLNVFLYVRLLKKSQDLLHQISSNFLRSFVFKCRKKFHIMPWLLGIG